MGVAITNIGQTRINVLRGAEQPLVIDRMIFANVPGADYTAAVDRAQNMPPAEQIVHSVVIEHKGYVNPDQVVHSVILGADLGDFTFNWIGIVEAGTDNVIQIAIVPETIKYKTNLQNNTTGNCITRNILSRFVDAQDLTGITVQASTWQYDFTSEMNALINDHLHDDRYSKIGHLHDDRYSKIGHLHDERYSKMGHLHDERYARLDHTHKPFLKIGSIDLLPFRPVELPTGWYFSNGDGFGLTTPQGIVLNSLSTNFKTDWAITTSGGSIFLPNLFHTDGRGFFFRAVDGTMRQVGSIEADGLPNITGTISAAFFSPYVDGTGAMGQTIYSSYGVANGSVGSQRTVTLDASKSDPTYGSGDGNVNPLNKGMTPAIYLGV